MANINTNANTDLFTLLKKKTTISRGVFPKISNKFLIFPVKEHFVILIKDFDVTT